LLFLLATAIVALALDVVVVVTCESCSGRLFLDCCCCCKL